MGKSDEAAAAAMAGARATRGLRWGDNSDAEVTTSTGVALDASIAAFGGRVVGVHRAGHTVLRVARRAA